MKKIVLSAVVLCSACMLHAQNINKIINTKDVTKIEKVLSADDMQGRRAFTPGIDKASSYIESEFKKIGLQTFNGAKNFKQEFSMTESKNVSLKVLINGKAIDKADVVSFSYQPQLAMTEKSDVPA